MDDITYLIHKQQSGTFDEMTEFCESMGYQLFEPRISMDHFMEVFKVAKKNGLGTIWLNLKRKYPGSL